MTHRPKTIDRIREGDHVVLFDGLPNNAGLDVRYDDPPDVAIEGGDTDAVFTGPRSFENACDHARRRQAQSGGRFVVAKVVETFPR